MREENTLSRLSDRHAQRNLLQLGGLCRDLLTNSEKRMVSNSQVFDFDCRTTKCLN
jgi:hypothetical protein